MTPDLWYALVGAGLCVIGLYGFVVLRHLLRRVMAFNVIGPGCFLIMVGLAQHGRGVDPVPQALVITGIVVAVAATALALVLIRRWFEASGHADLGEDEGE